MTPGQEICKSCEGLYLTAYLCPANYPTIGYGTVILGTPALGYKHPVTGAKLADWRGLTITEDEAEKLFNADWLRFQAGVLNLTGPLTANRADALTDFAYNLGLGRLKSSTLLKRVRDGDHEGAIPEIHKWVFGGGRKLPGLVKRRRLEAELYAS